VRLGARLKLKICFDIPKPAYNFDMGIGFDDLYGKRIFTAHSVFEPDRPVGEWIGQQAFVCDIPSFTLMPGTYNLRIWLDINHAEADLIDDAARLSVLGGDYYGSGKAPWNGCFVLPHRWSWDQAVSSPAAASLASKAR
jgi:hypothetical protein